MDVRALHWSCPQAAGKLRSSRVDVAVYFYENVNHKLVSYYFLKLWDVNVNYFSWNIPTFLEIIRIALLSYGWVIRDKRREFSLSG